MMSKKILGNSGSGKRAASAWLRTFAKTLPDFAGSIPEWEAHIKAEHELFTQFPTGPAARWCGTCIVSKFR